MNRLRKILCFVILVFLVFCAGGFWGSNAVFAAEDDIPDYRLAITPTQKNWENFEPGESYDGLFKIRNTGKYDFDFVVTLSPYSVESETYNPNFDIETQYTEITDWIELEHDNGAVRAGEEVELRYRINVPVNAHGGMQSATIMISMRGAEDSNVQAVRRLGYLIYGNVDGDVIKTGKVIENKIPSFLFNPPITATSVVENTGNVYTVAQYSLQVFPLFSDEEIYTNEETPEGNVVFPETKKLNTISWEGAPQLGIFKVRQTVKIFDEESATEKIVFLCPLWFLFIVILLIFCIIFWIVSRIIKRKKENY